MPIKKTIERLEMANQSTNYVTGAAHAAVVFFAYLALIVPKYGQIAYNFLMSVGEQYTLDSIERDAVNRDRIVKLTALENQAKLDEAQKNLDVAESDRAYATAAAPLEQQAADKVSTKDITEDQTRADLAVTQGKTKAEIRILREKEKGQQTATHAREDQEVQRAQQDSQLGLKEQATSHRTKMFSRLQTHLDKMTELHGDLASAENAASTAAQKDTAKLQASNTALLSLSKAMNKNIQANSDLHAALGKFDQRIIEGDMRIGQEQEVRRALITAMQADITLDTMIATTQIQHKSDLQQAFKSDVADKNLHLDSALSTYATETLSKLAELIETDLASEQEKITTLDNPEDIATCHAHLDQLLGMLNKVNQINVEKQSQEVTPKHQR